MLLRFIHTTTITTGVPQRISRRGPEYFIRTLAVVSTAVREGLLCCSGKGNGALVEPDALRRFDPRSDGVDALCQN